MDYLILNLNKRKGSYFSHFSIETLTVLMSRVKRLDHIFMLPFYEPKPVTFTDDMYWISQLGYLTELSNDPYRSIWYQCWSPIHEGSIEEIWTGMEPDRVHFLLTLAIKIESRSRNRNNKHKNDLGFDEVYEQAYQRLHQQEIIAFNEVLMRKVQPSLEYIKSFKSTSDYANELRKLNKADRLSISPNTTYFTTMTATDKEADRKAMELRKLAREKQLLLQKQLLQQAQQQPTIDYTKAFWYEVQDEYIQPFKSLLLHETDVLQDALDGDSNMIVYITFEERYEYITAHSFHSITSWLNTYVIDYFILLWESMRPRENYEEDIIVLSTFWYQSQSSYYKQHKDIDKDAYTNLYKVPSTRFYGKHLRESSIILFVVYASSHWYLVIINVKEKTVHNMNGFRTDNKQRHIFQSILTKWWKREHKSCNIQPCPTLKFHYHDKFGEAPENDIRQTDYTSCGVSVIMHAYYQIVENRIATMKDFSFSHMPTIRNYLGVTMYSLGVETRVMMQKFSDIEPTMIQESNEKKRIFYLYAIDHIPLRYQITDPNSQAVSNNDDDEVFFIHPDEGLQAILRVVNREPHFSDKKDKGLFEKEKDDYFVKITQ